MEQIFSNKTLDANQAIRHMKVQDLLADTHQSSLNGEAVDVGRAAFKTTLNLLSNTIFSVELADPNSDTAIEYKEIVWNVMKEVGRPNLADYFPVLKKMDPQRVRHRLAVHLGKILELFDRMISQRLHLRKVCGSNTNKDVLDTLLNISEENSEEMDKTTIDRLFLVSIISYPLCFFLNFFQFLFFGWIRNVIQIQRTVHAAKSFAWIKSMNTKIYICRYVKMLMILSDVNK